MHVLCMHHAVVIEGLLILPAEVACHAGLGSIQQANVMCMHVHGCAGLLVHMDCLHWVNRDSYLPQGSRGLKVLLNLLYSAHESSQLPGVTP